MVKVLSLNAVVNLVLSASLIPSLGINGAIIGTLAAEITGLAIEVHLVRKYVSIKWLLLECLPFAVIGAVMFVVVKAVGTVTGSGWISLGIQMLSGGIVYCVGTLVYIYLFKRNLLDRGIGRIFKKLKIKR